MGNFTAMSTSHKCYTQTSTHFLRDLLRGIILWMKLEPIIQSKVSQKEKHQYSILMHIYGI